MGLILISDSDPNRNSAFILRPVVNLLSFKAFAKVVRHNLFFV